VGREFLQNRAVEVDENFCRAWRSESNEDGDERRRRWRWRTEREIILGVLLGERERAETARERELGKRRRKRGERRVFLSLE
jgi:hypothetical protein